MDDGKLGGTTLLKDSVGVDNWSRYLGEMSSHNKTWGDEATLLAASVLFKAEIVVVSSLSEDYCHIVTPPDVWNVKLRCASFEREKPILPKPSQMSHPHSSPYVTFSSFSTRMRIYLGHYHEYHYVSTRPKE